VLITRTLDRPGASVTVDHPGGQHTVTSLAGIPSLVPRVELVALGARALRSALVLPTGYTRPTAHGPCSCCRTEGPTPSGSRSRPERS
jgi:hypothetical protein